MIKVSKPYTPFLHLYGGGSLFILLTYFLGKSKLKIHWQGFGEFPQKRKKRKIHSQRIFLFFCKNVHFRNAYYPTMSDFETIANFQNYKIFGFEKMVSKSLAERRKAKESKHCKMVTSCEKIDFGTLL